MKKNILIGCLLHELLAFNHPISAQDISKPPEREDREWGIFGLHSVGNTEKEYAEAFPAFFYTIKKNRPNAVLIWATTSLTKINKQN